MQRITVFHGLNDNRWMRERAIADASIGQHLNRVLSEFPQFCQCCGEGGVVGHFLVLEWHVERSEVNFVALDDAVAIHDVNFVPADHNRRRRRRVGRHQLRPRTRRCKKKESNSNFIIQFQLSIKK